MLFCDAAMAARIEDAEAGLVGLAAGAGSARIGPAGFVTPVAGGVATYAGIGSPFTKVAGLGFGGELDLDRWAGIERAFADRATPVSVELATLADPALAETLTGRGYRLVSYENVLGRALSQVPAGMRSPEVVRGADPGAWADIVADGVVVADVEGVPAHEEFPRQVVVDAEHDLVAAGAVPYLALLDGVPAGGASMRIADGIAQLTGAATVPAQRRRGVQSALLTARLADAAAAGCDLAVVTTQPGSRSQLNVQRSGFELLYSRAVLRRG